MGRRTAGVPQDPGYQGYTPVIPPPGDPREPFEADTVTSSAGFLFMGILISALDLLIVYGTWMFIATGDWAGLAGFWWGYFAMAFVNAAVWGNYASARREERHRAAYALQETLRKEQNS